MSPSWQFLTGARTLWAECRGEPIDGQKAVAHVIWNRVKDGRWGKTLAQVCLYEYEGVYQFSGWSRRDPNFAAACALSDNDSTLLKMLAVLTQSQVEPDPVEGAMYYWADSLPEPPLWAAKMVVVRKIGRQTFLREH